MNGAGWVAEGPFLSRRHVLRRGTRSLATLKNVRGTNQWRWRLRAPSTVEGVFGIKGAKQRAELALQPSGDVCDGCGTTVDVTPLDQLGSFCSHCRQLVEVE